MSRQTDMSTVITSPTHGRVLICTCVLAPAAEIETASAGVTGGSGPSPKMHYSLSGRCQTSGNEPGITIKPTLMSIRRLFITDRELGLPVLKTVTVHSSLLLEPTAMAAVTLLCAPRLEHYMVLGPVLGQPRLQVAGATTITDFLVTSKETRREPT
ncbi:hypothetical protein J6590_101878, partial [Homalodisca vitripennis]